MLAGSSKHPLADATVVRLRFAAIHAALASCKHSCEGTAKVHSKSTLQKYTPKVHSRQAERSQSKLQPRAVPHSFLL